MNARFQDKVEEMWKAVLLGIELGGKLFKPTCGAASL